MLCIYTSNFYAYPHLSIIISLLAVHRQWLVWAAADYGSVSRVICILVCNVYFNKCGQPQSLDILDGCNPPINSRVSE